METPRYFYHPDLSIWLSVDPISDTHYGNAKVFFEQLK